MIIIQCGDPKKGKDCDAMASLPDGFFIGPPDAFLACRKQWGFEVAHVEVQTLREAREKILERVESAGVQSPLIVSDLSILAENSRVELEKNAMQAAAAEGKKPDGWTVWKKLEAQVNAIFALLQKSTPIGVVNLHTLDPVELDDKTLDGKPKKSKGGLAMPSARTAKGILRLCSAIFRVVEAAGVDGAAPQDSFGGHRKHPFLYECDPAAGNGFITGSRLKAPKLGPMNIGQILRANGFELAYKYDWMGECVSRGSAALLKGKSRTEVIKWVSAFVQQHAKGMNGSLAPTLDLALREVLDAAEIHVLSQNKVEDVLAAYGV